MFYLLIWPCHTSRRLDRNIFNKIFSTGIFDLKFPIFVTLYDSFADLNFNAQKNERNI